MGKWKAVVLMACLASILASGCSEPTTNTASYIKITDKGSTDNRYWAKAIDPYSGGLQEFQLTIDSRSTWNLIEVDQEYFASYEYVSLDENAELLNIQYPADERAEPDHEAPEASRSIGMAGE
ncbi:hypothetical protein [Paenibacillus arenilitoris]|uniref:Uncharacterized protein n=1 Tax=Paenibacillus arenilitoris TaxID=2772299 RepID=A0A927CN23_9BACL|nr:hypothetical protein [Paenibacillus arenilitoris]MBD2869166.1 hypothetical protein [Paenibacillus arenilitoris]